VGKAQRANVFIGMRQRRTFARFYAPPGRRREIFDDHGLWNGNRTRRRAFYAAEE
jgi:hypothetical protein